MENKYWILITILGAVWGSAFMFIKIATPELGPIALVNIRLAVAGLIFIPFLLQQKYLKHFRSNLKNIFVLSVINTALPFSLFAYASLESSSNMLSILNGTTAIMAVVISTIWLRIRLNFFQIIGVFIGLFGIVVLANPDNVYISMKATIFCLSAAFCYAFSANYIQKFAYKTNTIVLIGWSLVIASVLLLPITFFNLPSQFPSNNVIFSILWLGVISTGVAFLGYVRLIEKVGAVKTATVAYFIPVFGVIWGYIFLGEPITLQILIGMILILIGIVFTNKRYD
jgi:Predicted permease, DMT superfamily